jgi:hypothetical protein
VGEKHNHSFQLSFNPCLKVEFQGSRVTSEGDKNGWEGRAGSSWGPSLAQSGPCSEPHNPQFFEL